MTVSANRSRVKRVQRVLLGSAIAAVLYGSAVGSVLAQAQQNRVVVPAGVYVGDEPGATLMHDYGSFQLYRVDNTRLAELRSIGRGAIQVQKDLVEFEASGFDTVRASSADIPAAFRAGKPTGPAVRLVQFAGPIVDAWLDSVRATGARVVQYIPNNAYLVLADAAQQEGLGALVEGSDYLTYANTLDPWYKLNRDLADRVRAGLDGSRQIKVTVLLASHGGDAASRSAIAASGTLIRPWSDLRGMHAITLSVSESELPSLAQLPDVLAIENFVEPELQDEVQAQIIAGNLVAGGAGPTAPGYLPFLTGLGFSTNPADYPIVSVVDDGVGNGTTVNGAGDSTLTRDRDGVTTRIMQARNCTTDADARGVGGHGHINSSIVGGYDLRAGTPFQDALFYQRGQGMNPYTRLANIKIFTNAGGFSINGCGGGSIDGLIKANQDSGSVISSNSWGAAVGGDYNADARAYDIGTRDADTDEAGVQPMIFLFAAGNSGSGAATVGSPGTAKNVITVGASENQRPGPDESGAWTDGCGVGATGADNAMDVIGFSSRGPAEGGRVKPEVIAPGTHIQGTASNAAGYDGSGVCDQFRPTTQTTFAASSGTSHSTPALAGVSSLVYRYLQTEYGQTAPSAAMTKAYLIAHPTYLTGVAGNGNLPTNSQGYGMPNLGGAFDSTTDRLVFDQQTVFGASGESTSVQAVIVDSGKPARIAMVYSDAPGATSGNPAVNNLNLSAVNDGNTYLGNVFSGAFSVTGGAADAVNNYEGVFLPAGTTGALEITVTAANIAGDGVPGNADTTDQDFALVCINCSFDTTFTLDATPESAAVCTPADASFNIALTPFSGFVDPVTMSVSAGLPGGATASFNPATPTPPAGSVLTVGTTGVAFGNYTLTITGTSGTTIRNDDVALQVSTITPAAPPLIAPANGASGVSVTPTLSWTAVAEAVEYVVEVDDDPAFTTINYTATVPGGTTSHAVATSLSLTNQYYWRVRARNSCGEVASATFSFTTGALTCTVYTSTDVPRSIGPGSGVITNSVLNVVGSAPGVADLDVLGLVGTHTFVADLDFELVGPALPARRLFGDVCGSSDNFNLNLDDAAATTVGAGTSCPITGGQTLRPENPLAFFNGIDPNGTWTLRITDDAAGDGGSLTGWGLRICTAGGTPPVVASDESASVDEDDVLTVGAPGVLGNDIPSTGLTAAVVTPPADGVLALDPAGGYAYTPDADFCGTDSFVYQASDGINTDPATVTLVVDCVNDLPVAANDAYVVNEDTLLDIPAATGVLANDTDPVEGSALIAVSASDPPNGSVVLNANGSFQYTADANYCGSDSFTYSADDGSDPSVPATVSIDVVCINDAPVAVDDSYNATEDTVLTVSGPGVLGNDTDVENSALAPIFPSTPANGTVSLANSGGLVYTPAADFCGSDSFTYRVTDGQLFSATATVNIAVACVDDAPQAVADTATVAEGAAATDIDVLANDTDADAGPRSVQSVTQSANGTVTIGTGGANVAFQPAANFCGTTNFTYTLNGGSVGTVTVTVTCDEIFANGFEGN